MTELTPRFEEALVYTTRLHAGQVRKVGGAPYLTHLLSVTALVLEDGGDEDQAIAALLHDAVEDQGGLQTLAEIRERFGDRVAQMVDDCTDSYEFPKRPWQERKEQYLSRLPAVSPEAQRVSLADKVDNARAILYGLWKEGDEVWNQFKGGRDGTLWYYREVVLIFRQNPTICQAALRPGYLVEELERLVAEMHRRAGVSWERSL